MASNFPSLVDVFANPVYTKVNNEDTVDASHVNDIQDAVVAVQETLVGAGKIIDYTSNFYIADNTSFKVVVEALDSAINTVNEALATHIGYVLPTDPRQHHANVIEVTASGNLSSDYVQAALTEHQGDIDNIMTGGHVEGVTLDDRYLISSGTRTFDGDLTISGTLDVNGATVLGNDNTDTLTVSGKVTAQEGIESQNDITVPVGSKIAETGEENSSYIEFGADFLDIHSHKDITLKLDSDDATDGNADAAMFTIQSGLGANALTVNEDGDLTILGDFTFQNSVVNGTLYIGGLSEVEFNSNSSSFNSNNYHIQLDKNNSSPTTRFFITQDGDTGNILASPDMLLNLDESANLTTGIHVLKSGVQETGYFGQQVYSTNAGGVFFGNGVNFKHQMTNPPSSVTLTVDENVNASNISITDINEYGFFWEFDTVAIGSAKVRGTYTTIGN